MLAVVAAAMALAAEPLNVAPNFWSREGVGSCVAEGGGLRLEHPGTQDWAVNLAEPISVQPGDVLRVQTTLQIKGTGTASVSFVVRSGDEVLQWTAGHRSVTGSANPQTNVAGFVVPHRVTTVQPRLTGYGPLTLRTGGFDLQRTQVDLLDPADTARIQLRTPFLEATLDPFTLELATTDRRNGKVWRTRPLPNGLPLVRVESGPTSATLHTLNPDASAPMRVRLELDPERPELLWTLDGEGALLQDLALPGALVAGPGAEHILPMNMGVRFPAEDPAIDNQWLVGYGGHGICMGFYGQLEGGAGALSIIPATDDFLLRVDRRDGRLEAEPNWQPEKGRFGYPRQLRMAFFEQANIATFANRYREHAESVGLVKTLTEKAADNPNVARLARAANLWTWDDKRALAEAAYEAGFREVLWSGGGSPEELTTFRSYGWLAGRYDIYQDVMDPAKFPDLPWVHSDWTTGAWPDLLVRDETGDWVRGWVVQDKEGNDVPCAVCCDLEALAFARERISKELKTHPYDVRFIDTTTATQFRECYDPRHPMTRRQSREARMELLQLVTDFGLVCGSETGHEASVPHLVYYEGMMSLGPFRVPDAGTMPPLIYDELPEPVLTFQLGPKYRIPLWQLVYGDCTVSTWYWGDFNNKHLGTWKLRDLWNMLYGTPPMYFTDPAFFAEHRERFIESYRDTQSVLRHAAMRRMVAFRDLTPDRTVQQTEWDNGLVVTVNFGDQPFDGIPPGEARLKAP